MLYRILPSPQTKRADTPARATVLIVEDNAELRPLFCEMLSTFGYRVIAAATVHEAEEARQGVDGGRLNLVIADIHLTADFMACEGYALFQRWTAADAAIRFILMSEDVSSLELPAIHTGTVPFLLKPLTAGELLEVVRAVLGE